MDYRATLQKLGSLETFNPVGGYAYGVVFCSPEGGYEKLVYGMDESEIIEQIYNELKYKLWTNCLLIEEDYIQKST